MEPEPQDHPRVRHRTNAVPASANGPFPFNEILLSSAPHQDHATRKSTRQFVTGTRQKRLAFVSTRLTFATIIQLENLPSMSQKTNNTPDPSPPVRQTPVSDESVLEYARLLRSGGPLAKVFPCRLSECAFTDDQRELIRQARHARAALQKKPKPNELMNSAPEQVKFHAHNKKSPVDSKPLTKLRKLLYLQSGRCFFCGEELREDKASVEHLLARKWGGKSEESNEVVCHSSLNATFGAMDLRSKFEFVIRSAGKFRCP